MYLYMYVLKAHTIYLYTHHTLCAAMVMACMGASPDATIKYMMGGGVSSLMQSLWPSSRGILVCCIMSWYFVVLGFNKRALF